jgi:C4-dicarboxylate-specific signal transduction histidine kinase
VTLALGITFALKGLVSSSGFVFFYAAIVASAWFGSKWAGALAVVLSSFAIDYFFMVPIYSLTIDLQSLPIFLEFAATAVLVGWFSAWRRRADAELKEARDGLQVRVEERTMELSNTNQRLLAEMAERKRTEEAYLEAQAELGRMTRMSSLGALAASISHEVNQPLAAVVANADACSMWLSSEPPNIEEARIAIESVAQQGTRASEVVRKIRAMFTKETPEKAPVEINELIREVVGLLHAEAARNDVDTEIRLSADLPKARGDRVQLQQVLVNLTLNAIEAMNSVSDRPRRLVIASEARDANSILVSVKDSGVGIHPTNTKRVFNAFFTTKAQGMGMGLAVSHSIIEVHGGRLWATGNPDCGATFQFTLPVD